MAWDAALHRSIVSVSKRRRADMRCTIVLEFDDGSGTVAKRVEVMQFHRVDHSQASGDVGLSLRKVHR